MHTPGEALTPRISIIIPVRNDAAALAEALEWLRYVDGIQDTEVIAAAAGDPAGTLKAATGHARVVWPQDSTRAALMNAGAAAARGDVLFFLHADSLPPAKGLHLMERALSDAQVVGGAFQHRFGEADWRLRAISSINRIRYRLTGNYYGDQGLFVRASVFRRMGGFRELGVLEDLDFSRRLRRVGKTVLVRAWLVTSGRRFLARGPWRTLLFIVWLLVLHGLGFDTGAWAERWRGPADAIPGSPWPKHRWGRTGVGRHGR